MPNVSFIPKESAEALSVPANVISINSPNEFTRHPVEHKRLLILSFYPNDYHDFGAQGPTEDTARRIIDFVISCNEEDIIVHCGEGRMRSAAVAVFLERCFDYDIDFQAPGCIGSVGGASDKLFRLLRRTLGDYKRLIRKLKSSGHELKAIDWEAGRVQYIPAHLKAERFPGYLFYPPACVDGTVQLTMEERAKLMYGSISDNFGELPTDENQRTDLQCMLDNNRIPTHKYVVSV